MALKFFGDDEPIGLAASAYDVPRPIVASTERLNFKKGAERIEKRPTSAWQTSAWVAFDTLGEVHLSFSLIGQLMSRVRLFPAIIEKMDQPPIHIAEYMEQLKDKSGQDAPETQKILKAAGEIVNDLILNAEGGVSTMLRLMALNFSIPGELYLLENKGKWIIASTDELQQTGNQLTYKKSKTTRSGASTGQGEKLPQDAFVARLWRPHPRYSGEPDSSMIGVLDDCELLILTQQAMRSIARSRMSAGVLFLPEGISSFVAGNDGMSVEEAIVRSVLDSVQDETAQATVVPQILKGPADLGEKIKWLPIHRPLDDLITIIDRTLQRVLTGLDIPREIVSGMQEVRYSNAIVISDSLYKAHIEPLVLLCIDSLSAVYLKPLLIKKLGLSQEKVDADPTNIIHRLIFWADTSNVTSRPDQGQAANEGYDRHALSARAWRDTRGFAEVDKPDPLELLVRLVLEKGQPPPDMVETIIRSINPDFFRAARAENSEIPSEIESLLNPGEVPPGPAPEGQTGSPMEQALSGGEVSPNGALPPRTEPVPVS